MLSQATINGNLDCSLAVQCFLFERCCHEMARGAETSLSETHLAATIEVHQSSNHGQSVRPRGYSYATCVNMSKTDLCLPDFSKPLLSLSSEYHSLYFQRTWVIAWKWGFMIFSAQDTLGKYRRKIFLAILLGGLHTRGTRLVPFSSLGEVGKGNEVYIFMSSLGLGRP